MTNIAKNRNFIVDLLAIFFGIGTWIGVNGNYFNIRKILVNFFLMIWFC